MLFKIAYGAYWNVCGECSYINLQFNETEWYLRILLRAFSSPD